MEEDQAALESIDNQFVDCGFRLKTLEKTCENLNSKESSKQSQILSNKFTLNEIPSSSHGIHHSKDLSSSSLEVVNPSFQSDDVVVEPLEEQCKWCYVIDMV